MMFQRASDAVSSSASGQKRTIPYRVLVHGLPYFCGKVPSLIENENWEVHFHPRLDRPFDLLGLANDLRRCELAYTWGGRLSMGKFLRAAQILGKEKIVILWCGSDVFYAKQELADGKMDPWVASRIHWAASPTLADEVRSFGICCEYVQVSFVKSVPNPAPFSNQFSVLVFLPVADRIELYGWDRVVEVAQKLPFVDFHLVGYRDGRRLAAPPNVTVHGWIDDLTKFYELTTVLWRPVRHDAGISFMVLEALAHGRHVLYTYPLPGCVQVCGAHDSCEELQRLYALHHSGQLGLNYAGMETVALHYTRDIVRANLREKWQEIILA